MKLAPFLGFASFAVDIFAAPRSRHATESLGRQKPFSSGPQHVGSTTFGSEVKGITFNWAGAILVRTRDPFESVEGTFTVPTAVGPGTSVAVWIGFDGENLRPPVIQGGVFIGIESNGRAYYQGWTQWYPDEPVFYDPTEFKFRADDVLNLALHVRPLKALLIVKNTSLGGKFQKLFSPSNPKHLARRGTAEWIVERVTGENLMDFGTVTFSNCAASTARGRMGLFNAVPLSIQKSVGNSTIIAVGSIPNPSTVKVVYTGP